jgi:hypothetical protein
MAELDTPTALFVDEASNIGCTAVEEMRGKLVNGEPEPADDNSISFNTVDDYLTLEGDGDKLVLEAGDQTLTIADSEFHSKRDIRDFEPQVRDVLESMVYTALETLRGKIAKERLAREVEADKRNAELRKKDFLNHVQIVNLKALLEFAKKAIEGLDATLERARNTAQLNKELEQKAYANEQAAKAEVKRLEGVISKNVRPAIYLFLPEPYLNVRLPGFIVVDVTWQRSLYLCKSGRLATATRDDAITVFADKASAQKAIDDTRDFQGGTYTWSKNQYVIITIN